jgi:hypothetical protein
MTRYAVIPWLLVLGLFGKLINAWDRLPETIAVHFYLSNRPNSWVSKTSFAIITVAAGLGLAMVTSWVLRGRSASPTANLIITQLFVTLTFVLALWEVINFNVEGGPFRSWLVIAPLVLLLVFLLVARLVPGS